VVVFRCKRCSNPLTVPVTEVSLPAADDVRRPYEMDDGGECPPRMGAGTFAYDPEPSRFSWRIDKERGDRVRVPGGPVRSIVLSPGDVRGTRPIKGKGRRNGCCGPDGLDGPNLACTRCGAEVAIESADCWTWQDVVLDPRLVEEVQVRNGGATAQ
jgi:hypothetical protein